MDIRQSVDWLLQQKESVVRLFYDRLLHEYPDVRKYFEGVDLTQQATLLTMALVIVENNYSHSYPATAHYLRVLGHRHHERSIPKELFPKFGDCLLKTLQEIHADQWDDALETQWRIALDKAAETMLEGYERPYLY